MSTTLESIRGTIETIRFHHPQTGYSILLMTQEDGKRFVAVGNFAEPEPGDTYVLRGAWYTHSTYGRQFKVTEYEVALPGTREGVAAYLGSGEVKGIGEETARKIVAHFGDQTLQVLDRTPERLREVPGIGPKRQATIQSSWERQHAKRHLLIGLHSLGLTSNMAAKIYNNYGAESLDVIRTNPFQLVQELPGIGFKTADEIARRAGFPLDAPDRLAAGLRHQIDEYVERGHACLPQSVLVTTASQLLAQSEARVAARLDQLVQAGDLIESSLPGQPEVMIYPPWTHTAETHIAERVDEILNTTLVAPLEQLLRASRLDLEALIERATRDVAQFTLTTEQKSAVHLVFHNPIAILTGGPGTGKTTCLRTLVRAVQMAGGRVHLASPTGKAAQRLAEVTGQPASTLHRLLEFSAEGFRLLLEERTLEADLVVIDEFSMVDLELMGALLQATDRRTHLLLVGDADQLPSVRAGDVMSGLIHSGRVPVARLTVPQRQAEASLIVANAHRIRQGCLPVAMPAARDFLIFPEADATRGAELIVRLASETLPRDYGFDPLTAIQVLSPMKKGAVGVIALNAALQTALNPPDPRRPEYRFGPRTLRLGDRLIQTRNNYQKQTFNGDIGRIIEIDKEHQRICVEYAITNTVVAYELGELDELLHAFALTVHKSQGSEFPAVIIPVFTEHFVLLSWQLLYTAVSRAKKLCVLVGAPKALGMAVKNRANTFRYSGLAARLGARGAVEPPHD